MCFFVWKLAVQVCEDFLFDFSRGRKPFLFIITFILPCFSQFSMSCIWYLLVPVHVSWLFYDCVCVSPSCCEALLPPTCSPDWPTGGNRVEPLSPLPRHSPHPTKAINQKRQQERFELENGLSIRHMRELLTIDENEEIYMTEPAGPLCDLDVFWHVFSSCFLFRVLFVVLCHIGTRLFFVCPIPPPQFFSAAINGLRSCIGSCGVLACLQCVQTSLASQVHHSEALRGGS